MAKHWGDLRPLLVTWTSSLEEKLNEEQREWLELNSGSVIIIEPNDLLRIVHTVLGFPLKFHVKSRLAIPNLAS